MIDRQARNAAAPTVRNYAHVLRRWAAWCVAEGVTAAEQATPSQLRRYLLHLAQLGHNAGGVHHHYRALRTFLRWFAVEYAPPGWVNPAARVPAPKLPDLRLDPVPLDHVRAMLATCARDFTGLRDRALLLVLVDTGIRHNELTDLRVDDLDLATGGLLVRSGKGRKSRRVFVGNQTRRALAAYLRQRAQLAPAQDGWLWLRRDGGRLARAGVRRVVARRAQAAGVPVPGMHAFRRAFAVAYLRNGGDLITLQRLLGHSTLAMAQRYLALVDDDLRAAHARFGAVDRMLGGQGRGPPAR